MNGNIISAFGLSFLAGAATALGALLAFFVKKDNFKILALGLGFSAGVMIYVSFMEILPQAQVSLSGVLGYKAAGWAAIGSFFGGIVIASLIDTCLPQTIFPRVWRPLWRRWKAPLWVFQ